MHLRLGAHTAPTASQQAAAAGVNIAYRHDVWPFRDVGADQVRIQPDGTLVLSVVGQVPFDFTGILRINLDTGEVILEPRDRSAELLQRACSALTGG